MEEIALEDLDKYVRSFKEDKLLVIVLWTRFCPKCGPFKDRINYIKDDFNHLHFISSEIDEVQLFAPPGTPAMVGYYKGLREIENLGDLNDEELEFVLRNWYQELINRIRVMHNVDNNT